MELRHCAYKAFYTPEIDLKVALALALPEQTAGLFIAPTAPGVSDTRPGCPARAEPVHAAKEPKRSPAKPESMAALLQAIAHIEFNAIKTV